MATDNLKLYSDIAADVLASWDGDEIKPTSIRKHDGATIWTVYQNGQFVINGTLFELHERAALNEQAKKRWR